MGRGRKRKSTTPPSMYKQPLVQRSNLPCLGSACAPPLPPQMEEGVSEAIILGREGCIYQNNSGGEDRILTPPREIMCIVRSSCSRNWGGG
jgi:hypothetical protein